MSDNGRADRRKFEPSWTSPPDVTRVDHTRCYRCLISGIIYAFFATDKPIGFDASQIAINKAGDFLMTVKPLTEIPFLNDRAARIAHAITRRDSKA